MKYSLFFGETEKRILAAETPKEVMQIAWQAGVLLPKKAVLELFREVKKYRQQAALERMDDQALDSVAGGVDTFQMILCRYGLHNLVNARKGDAYCICACCGKYVQINPVPEQTDFDDTF